MEKPQRSWNKWLVGSWETTRFRRIECIAASPTDALLAVDERLRRMRASGWQIPAEAAIDLRPSGFGWSAGLVLPAHDRAAGFELRRRLERPRRVHSGVQARLDEVALADEAKTA
jgi:hypothetical protein